LPGNILTPLIVACALFMENFDGTVISTSLPAIAADLRDDPIALKLALTSYLLSLAIFIPASGSAADRFRARTVFRAASSRTGRLAFSCAGHIPHLVSDPLNSLRRLAEDRDKAVLLVGVLGFARSRRPIGFG
jgi:MFS family permease